MSNLQAKILLSILLLATTIHSISVDEKYGVTDFEFDTYFKSADADENNILDKHEAKIALTQLITKIFQRIGFWQDDPMIEALAEEIVKELEDETDKLKLKDISKTLPTRVKSFRAKIFNDLIEKFDLGELLNDESALSNLDQYPGTFGLTYENWKLYMFEMDQILKETQETLDKLKELTKDVQVDPEEYEKLYNQIMNEVYTDPEYQKIYEEFNELTAQANQLKDMIGEKNLDDIAERKKVQDMFDL